MNINSHLIHIHIKSTFILILFKLNYIPYKINILVYEFALNNY